MDYELSLADAGFTRRQRVDRAVHTLEGILKGIAIDGVIAPKELAELKAWSYDNRKLIGNHPFSELIPKIEAALSDGVIDAEEQADMLWLCQNLQSGSIYYDDATSDIQRLQGILHGILSEGEITDEEVRQLSQWTDDHSHLKGCYPYDEIDALLTQVLRDGQIDTSEREMLKLSGICAVCPDLSFADRVYSFTGASVKATRSQMASHIEALGATFSRPVTQKVHYLVVGANGNPAWAYACYGRKVEEAMSLRASGHPVVIVHENDFWDALQDQTT